VACALWLFRCCCSPPISGHRFDDTEVDGVLAGEASRTWGLLWELMQVGADLISIGRCIVIEKYSLIPKTHTHNFSYMPLPPSHHPWVGSSRLRLPPPPPPLRRPAGGPAPPPTITSRSTIMPAAATTAAQPATAAGSSSPHRIPHIIRTCWTCTPSPRMKKGGMPPQRRQRQPACRPSPPPLPHPARRSAAEEGEGVEGRPNNDNSSRRNERCGSCWTGWRPAESWWR
jgi:hypothetical protein